VIGDVRVLGGFFISLPGKTVEAFEAADVRFCNDAILVTAARSLPIRAGRQFGASIQFGRHPREKTMNWQIKISG